MNNHPAHRRIPFPLERRLQLDLAWIHRRKSTISGLIEVDVTTARRTLRAYQANTGTSLSFTAFVVACLARALDENKALHAYRNWRNQLVIFDEVDVAVMIEISLQKRTFPLLHVIRGANGKTMDEIHREIRSVQADPRRSPNFGRAAQHLMRWFLILPGFARHLVYRVVLGNPQWFKEAAGTVAVTSVGMFGKGAGWGLDLCNHTLSVAVGGIGKEPRIIDGRIAVREILNLTLSFDHVIVDGAPAARFANRFKELIESDFGLPVAHSMTVFVWPEERKRPAKADNRASRKWPDNPRTTLSGRYSNPQLPVGYE